MKKQETFRRLLAGEYDDGCLVTLKEDDELLLKMRSIGWWPYSRPLNKDNPSLGPLETYKEGSKEWKKDILLALKNLGRI